MNECITLENLCGDDSNNDDDNGNDDDDNGNDDDNSNDNGNDNADNDNNDYNGKTPNYWFSVFTDVDNYLRDAANNGFE